MGVADACAAMQHSAIPWVIRIFILRDGEQSYMGKVLKAIAVVAIAVAVAVAAPYLAPGLVSVLGSVGITVTAAVATGIAGALLSAAAALALSAFAGKPSSAAASPTDIRQSLGVTQIIIGKCRVGAILTFFHPRQAGKSYFRYFVWTIAGHRCAGLTTWYLNDLATTVDGSGKIMSGPYAGSGWLWFERGEHAAAPNGTFVAECGGRWTNAHVGNGIAKIYAKFEMTDAIVSAGMPNITIEVEGTDEVYDPRSDTTGYTNNGALVFYWWMALPRAEGGFGCYDDEIDQDWVSAQANVCDEDVPLKAGGTEKRYALDGFLTTGADPSSVRDVLVANMAGRFTYSGGLMLMRPGYWVPVSTTLTEDDLVAGISYDLLTASDQRVTEVDATWNDPSNLYQQVALPARSIDDPDAAQASLDLPFVKSHARAERIQKIKLLQSAAEKTLQWPVNIVGLGVGPMDTVRLATSRYSLDNYAFTVANWGLAQDFSVALTVREENEDMYDWDPNDESDYAVVDRIARADPIADLPPGSVQSAIATSFPIGLTITAAADGTVTINDHTRRYTDGHADVPVTGATLATALAPGAFRAIGYDDADRVGGAVTYQLFANDIDARVSPANPGRHYVGYVTIPTAGSPPADGGGASPPGGNCVTVETPVMMADGSEKPAGQIAVGDRLWTRHEDHLSDVGGGWGLYPVEAVSIADSADVWQATIGGRVLNATGDHLVYTGTWVAMRDIGQPAAPAKVVKMTVTSAHTYVSNGILSHNIKQNQQLD